MCKLSRRVRNTRKACLLWSGHLWSRTQRFCAGVFQEADKLAWLVTKSLLGTGQEVAETEWTRTRLWLQAKTRMTAKTKRSTLSCKSSTLSIDRINFIPIQTCMSLNSSISIPNLTPKISKAIMFQMKASTFRRMMLPPLQRRCERRIAKQLDLLPKGKPIGDDPFTGLEFLRHRKLFTEWYFELSTITD